MDPCQTNFVSEKSMRNMPSDTIRSLQILSYIMDTDKLETFQSVCGTDEDTATHVLASFGGDLDRAVNFFMENGEQGVATLQSFGSSDPQPASAPPAPIDLDEDDEGPIVVSSQSPDQQQAARDEAADQHGRNQGWLEEEAALQEALEASKVTAPGSTRSSVAQGTSTPGRPSSAHRSASEQTGGSSDVEEYEPDYDSDVEMDTEEEYAAKLAAAQQAQAARLRRRNGGDGAGPSGAAATAFFDGLNDNAGPRIRGSRPSGAAAAASQQLHDLNAFSQRLGIPMPPTLPGMAGMPSRPAGRIDDEDGDFEDGAGPSGLGMPGGAGLFGAAYGAGGHDSGLPDMPAGVDLEEARMLEAAMLGIPYAGRLPDFGVNGAAPPGGGGFGGAAAQPLSPGVHHTRALREEQDWAFQASLQADREKAEAEERAQREAEQESARMAAAAQAAAAAAAEAEAHRAQTLADKAAALPPEPPSGAADTVAVLIRLPNGQRLTRRFLKTDRLQTLYDFVDTSEPGEEWPHSSYLLVTSRPRKVYEETAEQTLADAGLTQKQEMLLLEPKG